MNPAGSESTSSPRPRDLGVEIGTGKPGRLNAITDVAGVRVGHATVVRGSGQLEIGVGPVRTGVTVVLPSARPWDQPLYAGFHRVSGVSEVTGLLMLAEWGMLTGPIATTTTWSVGTVRDALAATAIADRNGDPPLWGMPVVAETWDGLLNDAEGQHVTREHVEAALAAASQGRVAEGNVGGGTGMACHGFKGGIGTSSRLLHIGDEAYTVGVLVQTNHGSRSRLTIAGRSVGERIPVGLVPIPDDAGHMYGRERPGPPPNGRGGSIIVIIATDAPLLPQQCSRIAQRASFGIARTGGAGENWSGDMLIAFSTANRQLASTRDDRPPLEVSVHGLSDIYIDDLFYAAIESTEEAIVNALFAAQTMTGRDDNVLHALPHDLVLDALAT
jgi:D-aminopeptidase